MVINTKENGKQILLKREVQLCKLLISSVGCFSANMKICGETAPTDFSCQTNWGSITKLFEINGGLSRMYGNIHVRFLRGKGAVRLPTYPTYNGTIMFIILILYFVEGDIK